MLIVVCLFTACGPAERTNVVNNFSVAASSPSYRVEEISVSQSQFFGNLTGSISTSVIQLQVLAQAEITITSFDLELNAGGSLSFSDPILINELGNVAGVSVPIGHFQHRITLNSPLTLQAGESSSFSVIFEVFADPGRTGVLQATLTNVAAVSQGAVVDFVSPITGPLVIFEGAPVQVEIEDLGSTGQVLTQGENGLLRIRITALEDTTLFGLDVTLFKGSGIDVSSIQIVDAQGSDLGNVSIPFLNSNENVLLGSVLFSSPIQLQAGNAVELEYKATVSFTRSNLVMQAVLNRITGTIAQGPIVGPIKQS